MDTSPEKNKRDINLTPEVMIGFVGSLLASKYDTPVQTPSFHLELWDYCCSDEELVAVAAPRRHAKSTSITHAWLLASVLFRTAKFVLLVSDTETQAINFLNDIKQDLKNNENLISLFQVSTFIRDTETDIIVQFEDGDTFRILTRGAEQKVRGIKWNHLRPDLIIIDDLENDELVANKERRDKLKRWFNAALLPAKSKEGKVRIIGTILHEDSILNNLMPIPNHKNTIFDGLKTTSLTKRNSWVSVKYRAHNEDFSKILWPELYTKEYFQNIKLDLTEQGLSEIYAQEHLNEPIDRDTAFFKREDLNSISETTLEDIYSGSINLNYYIGVDLAVSEANTADYSVFIVVGIDQRNTIYVLDVIRERMDTLTSIDTFFELQDKYNPDWFVMEKGGIEKAITPILKKEMVEQNTFFDILTFPAIKDKKTRAKIIQARMRAKALKIDHSSHWYSTFEDEFLKFPKGKHDDQVDALSWIGIAYNKTTSADTPEEIKEEEYQEFVKTMDTGKSRICGY